MSEYPYFNPKAFVLVILISSLQFVEVYFLFVINRSEFMCFKLKIKLSPLLVGFFVSAVI
jgi:hypothetical protein